MDELINTAIGKIKMHPWVTLIMLVVVGYILYTLANRKNATPSSTPLATTGGAPPAPGEVINQTFNSYPITGQTSPTPSPVATVPTTTPTGGGSSGGTKPTPTPVKNPTTTTAQYVTVEPWPAQLSTLWGIAQHVGKSLATIEALNPQIKNYNLIYPGQQVRVA